MRHSLPRNKHTILDGEKLFHTYWVEMGSKRSIRQLKHHLASVGVRHHITERVPTDMAIWLAIWRWACNNPEDSYKICNSAVRDEGDYYSPDEWDLFLQKKMWTITKHNERLFTKWLNLHKKKSRMNEFINSSDTAA